jgi:hypothetical protein
MSIFSGSLVSTLVASIFVINAPLYAGEVEYAEDNDKGKKVERRIEIKAKSGKPVRILVDNDGQEHVFELTQQELHDVRNVNAKLQHLDRKTMVKVKQALANVSITLEQLKRGEQVEIEVGDQVELKTQKIIIDKGQHLISVEGLSELKVLRELMDEEHAVVVRERIKKLRRHHDESEEEHEVRRHDEEEHQRVFVIDGGEGNIVIDEKRQVRHMKIGRDNILLKGHLDAILKLIEHGEFTPDELDKLQQLLDSKR